MTICFMCDLHLPFDGNALQYDVLDWAIADIKKNQADCIAFVGDATADGNAVVYNDFVEKMKRIGIPFLYIPGNSDLRDKQSFESIYQNASKCMTLLDGVKIFAINDSDGNISNNQLECLENADENSIVFMHHPISCIAENARTRFLLWKERHKGIRVFYGHEHYASETEEWVSLQAMDPDKAIGENPCITYYDTQTRLCKKSYYRCVKPVDLTNYLGISCYRPKQDITFAIEKGLKNLELRPNILLENEEEIVSLISLWRKQGNTVLSIHLSEVWIEDDKPVVEQNYEQLIRLGVMLQAERFVQHVPLVSVSTIKKHKDSLKIVARFIAKKLNQVPYPCVLGVENMHMTKVDEPNDNRRFGYMPEETLEFMRAIAQESKHKVGINFDIGHARNNAPYSQKYQISTWFSMLGKYIVGYHLYQVTIQDGVFQNHMPITDVNGRLISYASFFRCWADGKINKAPCIFEMRPENSYDITLKTFQEI